MAMESSTQWTILKTFSNEPLKQKTTMKKNSFLWAALSMTAALVMTACSSDDNIVETPAAPQDEVKTIPYSVTVSGGDAATTRATVADDPSDATNYHKTLYFATGDQLYISSDSRTDLKGTLTLKAGDEGKSSGATFEGSITYTGDAPEGTTEIKATLVGSSNVGVQITDGKVTGVSYPLDAYCDDVAEVVQKYSNLTGTSTYGEKSFTLSQQTAFLNFEITFEDGTAENATLSTVVSNGGSAICTANVETEKDGEKVVAKFVLPVAKGTMLSSANVKFDERAAISFGASQTLTGKVYNVKKTQAAAVTTLNNTIKAWTAGSYAVPAGGLTYSDAITVSGDVTLTLTDGETLTLNKGISLASGATLTVEGNGAMVVNGTNNSTASTVAGSTGTLILTSGTLTATGGKGQDMTDDFETGASGGAAINGSVTVNGGSLTAKGGNGGNCIGDLASTHGGAGGAAISGDVTITDGAVAATGGNGGSINGSDAGYDVHGGAGGAAIGGNATLTGGTLTTTQGANGTQTGYFEESSVGAGGKAVAGTVTNNGGTVN